MAKTPDDLMPGDLMPGDLAIYVHWPYCTRICPYCDFNVYKARPDMTLVQAICADLSGWRVWSGPRRVTSIHFGGGTPSLMAAEDIHTIINQVSALWTRTTDCEVAIEANPNDRNQEIWKDYNAAGINRLSLGVQSFNDTALTVLGRDHDGAGSQAALTLARSIFPSVSMDLIFGWAGQILADLDADIDTALALSPNHISTYQLTIEDGTAFAKAQARGQTRTVGSEQSADFYDHLSARLTQSCYDHYEVSNFARPDHYSRHNLTYWYGKDYVGVGPGAHGRLTVGQTRFATVAALKPADYQHRVEDTSLGIVEKTALSPRDQAEEYMIMGLRITDGIDLDKFSQLGGQVNSETLADLIHAGLVRRTDTRIAATNAGRLVLNSLTETLLLN